MDFYCIPENTSSLQLRYAAFRPRSDSYCWGPGIREDYVIQYVKSGRGYLQSDGHCFPVAAGQCFLLFPGVVLHYWKDPEDPWTYGWADFSGEEARALLSRTALSPAAPVTDCIASETADLFLKLEDCILDGSPEAMCRGNGLLRLLLADLMHLHPAPASEEKGTGRQVTAQAAALVRRLYRRPSLTVGFLAQTMNMDRASLYRHFMQELGVSPKEFITRVRMEKAEQLLKTGNFSVQAIACSVGYTDPLYFSRAFRSFWGCSPRAYLSARSSEEKESAFI